MNAKEKYDALVSLFEQHQNQINAEAMAAYMKHLSVSLALVVNKEKH